tara:strand:- start:392 stop:556 length:165 start_codon:yes stop_codon:yes gene_type:complete
MSTVNPVTSTKVLEVLLNVSNLLTVITCKTEPGEFIIAERGAGLPIKLGVVNIM